MVSWATGYIAGHYALRPHPFYLGIALAVIGLILSLFFVRETLAHVELEARGHAAPSTVALGHVFYLTTIGNASLFAACQAGLVNNLNDGMSWGLYPLYFASFGLGVEAIGVIKAVYPGVWGVLQIATGPISDWWGRKALIARGMIVQAVGIRLTVMMSAYPAWITGAVLQGVSFRQFQDDGCSGAQARRQRTMKKGATSWSPSGR